MKSDEQLKTDVSDELGWEPSVNATRIGVEVKDGVVTLAGHVGSYGEKWNAERAAQRVSGVRALAVEMDVDLPGTSQRHDVDIARAAENVLVWTSCLAPNSVKVMVERGYITLTGEVDWEYQRQAATRAVRGLMGVVGVSDNIGIRPAPSSSAVKADIESALRRRAQEDASHPVRGGAGRGRDAVRHRAQLVGTHAGSQYRLGHHRCAQGGGPYECQLLNQRRRSTMESVNAKLFAFDTHVQAEEAIRTLKRSGFDVKKLSLIGKGYHTEEHPVGFYTAGDRIKAWGGTGAFWGALWGLLFAPAVFLLPGVGLVAMAGPVVAALVGALEGAVVVGGVSALGAALMQVGLPRDQVVKYETALKADKFVLMMHGTLGEVANAQNLLATHEDNAPA